MLLFFIYCLLFLFIILKWKSGINRWSIAVVFILKSTFIFFVSFTSIQNYSFLSVPDEDNYYSDIVLFHLFAKEYPLHYLKFLLDIEPHDEEIYYKYFTQTNAWFKSPEFFYNDNRWVIKIHSILSFVSGCNLAIHRLFSAFLSIIGWLWVFNFVTGVFNFNTLYTKKYREWIFLISSLFPSFFFFTNFILKESILLFVFGAILSLMYTLIIDRKKRRWFEVILFCFLILISIFFRPTYLLPLTLLSFLFLLINSLNFKHKVLVYVGTLIFLSISIFYLFWLVFHKNLFGIIQYRQERFLDASKGGIYLLNTKKFVRVPYDWKHLKIDSTNRVFVYRIKNNVPLMYWYLTNLNDTILELNKDTTESYHLLYYIEKANRTIYIPPLNIHKSILYNVKSISQSINVFFFYPKDIESKFDLIVWFENIMLMVLLISLIWGFRYYPLPIVYIYSIAIYLTLMISTSSPNTGAIIRYRYFLIPLLFVTFAGIIKLKILKEKNE